MLNDTVPTFRFNRPRTPIPSNQPPHRPASPQVSNGPAAAKPVSEPIESGRTGAEAGSREAVAADAERFLHQVNGAGSRPLDSAAWLQRAGLNIRKASDAQHVEAIALVHRSRRRRQPCLEKLMQKQDPRAGTRERSECVTALAYATYIRISASPLRAAIMAELETLSGRKRSRTTHDLHLIVERFVSYGGETAAERLAARKLISRDVRAIQHLEITKVLPSRVQSLASIPGQGLHAWARQRAVAKRVSAAPTDAIAAARRAKTEARQRALVHEVSITTRRPDGSRKAQRHFAITGVLGAEIAGLRRSLERLQMVGKCEASTR